MRDTVWCSVVQCGAVWCSVVQRGIRRCVMCCSVVAPDYVNHMLITLRVSMRLASVCEMRLASVCESR